MLRLDLFSESVFVSLERNVLANSAAENVHNTSVCRRNSHINKTDFGNKQKYANVDELSGNLVGTISDQTVISNFVALGSHELSCERGRVGLGTKFLCFIIVPILTTFQEVTMYSPQIMLEVFEKFLTLPPEGLHGGNSVGLYFEEYLKDSRFDHNLVLWHVAVLFDEFLIKQDILQSVFGNWRRENPLEYLNGSGQTLYCTLKQQCG